MGCMSHEPTVKPPPSEQIRLYRVLALSAVALVAFGTVVYQTLEDWSWVDSFYFSVVTVTTVGFGDITPTTDGAKLFTVLYIIMGISIVATFLDSRMKFRAHRRMSKSD